MDKEGERGYYKKHGSLQGPHEKWDSVTQICNSSISDRRAIQPGWSRVAERRKA